MTKVSGDIAAIAAGLSEAQRAVVSGLHEEARSTSSAYVALAQKKLVRWSRSQNYTGGLANYYKLTPLGLAVRAYMEGKSHD